MDDPRSKDSKLDAPMEIETKGVLEERSATTSCVSCRFPKIGLATGFYHVVLLLLVGGVATGFRTMDQSGEPEGFLWILAGTVVVGPVNIFLNILTDLCSNRSRCLEERYIDGRLIYSLRNHMLRGLIISWASLLFDVAAVFTFVVIGASDSGVYDVEGYGPAGVVALVFMLDLLGILGISLLVHRHCPIWRISVEQEQIDFFTNQPAVPSIEFKVVQNRHSPSNRDMKESETDQLSRAAQLELQPLKKG